MLRPVLTSADSEELAIKVDAGLNFLELAIRAEPMVRPILLYYACAHLCGVYTRTFFTWLHDSRDHGLSCTHQPRNVEQTKISIKAKGQFPRLSTTCFLLAGQPNPFSELVTYAATPTTHTESGGLLEAFGKTEVGAPIRTLTLHQLASFDYGAQLRVVRQRHGFHKFSGLPATAFLIDVIGLFVASSLARYDVVGWREILTGRTTSLRIYFEETFERFQDYAVDALLAALEQPLRRFGASSSPHYPSPYSHDDRSRFPVDPNADGI